MSLLPRVSPFRDDACMMAADRAGCGHDVAGMRSEYGRRGGVGRFFGIRSAGAGVCAVRVPDTGGEVVGQDAGVWVRGDTGSWREWVWGWRIVRFWRFSVVAGVGRRGSPGAGGWQDAG